MNRSRITGDLVSQNNIFVDIANDRVGIGSTIPTHKIDISGTVKLHDHTGHQNHITYSPSGPAPHLHFPTGPLSNLARTPYLGFGDRTSGGDFKIYHDYYNAHLKLVGLGGLFLSNNTGAIGINGANGSGGARTSIYLPAGANEGIKLYHGHPGSLKFEVVGYGVTVHGTTETQGLNVTGVTTTTGSVNVGDDLDVTDDLNIGGEFGMIGSSDSNKYFDVRTGASNQLHIRSSLGGASNLVTMLSIGRVGSSFVGNLTLGDSSDSTSAAGPVFTLNRNSSSPADADYLGQIKFAGRSDAAVQRNYAKITGKILDASNGTEDGIIEFSHIKAGSQVITGRFRSDSLQLLNGTSLTVAGTSTFSGDITVDSGTSSTIRVEADSGGEALFLATGGANQQATAAIELMQSTTSLQGGGMSYNGDGTPTWASGETADHITFYRRINGVRHEVFSYPYSSNNVVFNGTVTATSFSGSLGANNLTGTITSSVQSNITQLGTLGSLTVNGTNNPVSFTHTGANCVTFNRNGKTLSINANYAGQNGYSNIALTSGMALRFSLGGLDRIDFQSAGHIEPVTDSQINLGSNTKRFANVYADNLYVGNSINNGVVLAGITTSNSDITVPTSMDSTESGGVAIQRFWHTGTITNGNVYKCGQWYTGEGTVQLLIAVRSHTAGNSGTTTYMFQGSFSTISSTGIKRLMPLHVGHGHGNGADNGTNSNAWEVLIDNINNYTYAVYIHVPSGTNNKHFRVTVTEVGRGLTFTDISSTVAYSSLTVQSSPLLSSNYNHLGHTHLRDNYKINLGNSDDLQIYHDGTNGRIDSTGTYLISEAHNHIFRNLAGNEDYAKFIGNGPVELYHNNVKMFETTSTGASCAGSITAVGAFLNGDVQFTGDNYNVYWDKSENTLEFKDNAILAFGDSDDFTIKHVSSDSTTRLIETSGGSLFVQAGNFVVTNPAGNEFMINAAPDGAVKLYHDNVLRYQSYSDGVKISTSATQGRLVLADTSGNFAYQFTGTDPAASGESGGRLVVQDANGGMVVDSRTAGGNMFLYNTIKLNGNATADNLKLIMGAGEDLQLYHDGSNSYIKQSGTGDLILDAANGTADIRAKARNHIYMSVADTESAIEAYANQGVFLYFNGLSKLQTTSQGIQVENTGGTSVITSKGTGGNRADLQVLQTGTNSAHIWLDASNGDLSGADYANIKHDNSTLDLDFTNYANDIKMYVRGGSIGAGGLRKAFHAHENGSTELYHNGNLKLGTISAGLQVTGNVYVNDGNTYTAGGNNDGQYFHNGTDTYLQNSTGKLRIRNTHADEIKLDTNSTTRWNIGGTGHIYPDVNNTYDIGTTTYRVRNIYTNDLNLSNEGSSNDVDGTWGNYTIQEGEDDLFLINRRNGKKYKFNLTEVS